MPGKSRTGKEESMLIRIIYAISEDPEELEYFDSSSYEEKTELLNACYAENMPKEQSEREIRNLLAEIRNTGITAVYDPDTDICPNPDTADSGFRFITKKDLQQAKNRYFSKVLEEAREKVVCAHPEWLACDNELFNSLKEILKGGDNLYVLQTEYGEELLSFHDMIRQLKPDTVYYIAGTVVALRA